MPLDGLVLNCLKTELSESLVNTKLIKVYQPNTDILLLHLRGHNQTYKLIISVNPQHLSIHMAQNVMENPIQAPLFSMVLRKHIVPARLLYLEQLDLDRIIQIGFEVYEEGNKKGERLLISEFTGRNSNIVLVDKKTMTVIDALYHQEGSENRRCLYPGSVYSYPENTAEKANPLLIESAQIKESLRLAPVNEKFVDWLVNKYFGLSPFAAKEVLKRAKVSLNSLIGDLDPSAIQRVSESFTHIIERVKTGKIEPCIFDHDFWILPPTGQNSLKMNSLSQALETSFRKNKNEYDLKKKAQEVLRVVKRRLSRGEKKLNERLKEQSAANEADSYKEKADLIISNLYLYSPGISIFKVTSFTGESKEILVDPNLDGIGNAQKYYQLYQKYKRAAKALQEQVELARMEVAYLQQVITSIELAEKPSDLEEIKEELIRQGLIKQPVSKSKKESAPTSFLCFQTSGGTPVLVGKNNRQNEYLTHKIAGKDDLWLHVKDMPGSHVILRSDQPDDLDITEAATIAAYYSKARYSSKVAVDYTVRKNVRKPSGAPPGYVIYTNQKTVLVTPDENRILQMKVE
jgi:predicted ribosome quality control (RQC) complex YloA/Tae2 family protein